jgi:glycosyltransferase involved in cell wall biosynthesis
MNRPLTKDSSNPDGNWEDRVTRVVIQSASYLDFDGSYSAGGRQRHIRDLAELIRDVWGREVVVVQKGFRDFTNSDNSINVVGLRTDVRAIGDPIFAWKVRSLIRPSDGLIYASGEDAWPFFHADAKAIQHGIWWDGPQNYLTRLVQKHRAVRCVSRIRSMLCVDTNFINWLRCHGRTGVELCNKCEYIPNYVDTERLLKPVARRSNEPIRLIIARRYEEKRGINLFIKALAILKQEGFPFSAHISSVGNVEKIRELIGSSNLRSEVEVTEDDMDTVLSRYQFADLAVVPTIWSEGTSLACIEALCAGLPVIATPVGGLGNLIVPDFNGTLVRPLPEELAKAIRHFSAPAILARTSGNALAMREALSKKSWRSRVLSWLKF